MWTPRLLPAATTYEQQAETAKQQLLAEAQKQADAIVAEGKAAAEAERQHKLREADAQTTALARAMCEKLLSPEPDRAGRFPFAGRSAGESRC